MLLRDEAAHVLAVEHLHLAPYALHSFQQRHVVVVADIRALMGYIAEVIGAAAHHIVVGRTAVAPRMSVVEPQGVFPAAVHRVDNGGAVTLHFHLHLCVVIHIVPQGAAQLAGIRVLVGIGHVITVVADVGALLQLRRVVARMIGVVAGVHDVTGLGVHGDAGDIGHVLRRTLRGGLAVGLRLFQPVHHGVRGVGALPERYVAGVLRRNGGGQLVDLAVALAFFVQLVPADEAVAVAGGGSGHKGRAIAGVDVLRAVAAVGIQLDLIVIAVVVALEHSGAVRRHRLGIVIQLGEAARLILAQLQIVIGDDGARQGSVLPVIVHVLRVHVVVNVLEVVADGIGHRNGLVVDVDGVGLPGVARLHRQIQTLCADRSRAGVGGRRIIGVPIGRIAQICRGKHRLAVQLAALDGSGEAGVDGQAGHRVQIVDGDVDILRGAAARRPALRAPGRSRRRHPLRQSLLLPVQVGAVRLHVVGNSDPDGVGDALAAHRAAHRGAAALQRGRHHGIRQRQGRGGGVVDVHPVAVQLYLPLIVRVARLAGGLQRNAA